jgi:hypothetical protein
VWQKAHEFGAGTGLLINLVLPAAAYSIGFRTNSFTAGTNPLEASFDLGIPAHKKFYNKLITWTHRYNTIRQVREFRTTLKP